MLIEKIRWSKFNVLANEISKCMIIKLQTYQWKYLWRLLPTQPDRFNVTHAFDINYDSLWTKQNSCYLRPEKFNQLSNLERHHHFRPGWHKNVTFILTNRLKQGITNNGTTIRNNKLIFQNFYWTTFIVNPYWVFQLYLVWNV